MTLGVLCSGGIGYDTLEKLYVNYSIVFVFTNTQSTKIVRFCEINSIPLFKGNPRNGKALSFLQDKTCDVLVSVNYLFLIQEDLINIPKKLAFNIHGSLLPKYRGRTPHVWAIINNEEYAGITAHVIDRNCDTGSILVQEKVPIDFNDTGNTILKKYSKLYIPIIENVLKDLQNGKLEYTSQDSKKATCFGKRTPDDGLIDWNWSKERIRNWVRAQSYPYPGAFSFLSSKKVIIDWIEFSDIGFDYTEKNGTILSTKTGIVVKTPNGAVILSDVRTNKEICKKGEVFNET